MTKTQIIALLMSNDRAVDRAIVALYHRQTVGEQRTSSTTESNGRGFNAFHAERGTYWAKWVLSGRRLTGSHLAAARKVACYYARQLAELSVQPACPPRTTYRVVDQPGLMSALVRLDRFQEYPGLTQGL